MQAKTCAHRCPPRFCPLAHPNAPKYLDIDSGCGDLLSNTTRFVPACDTSPTAMFAKPATDVTPPTRSSLPQAAKSRTLISSIARADKNPPAIGISQNTEEFSHALSLLYCQNLHIRLFTHRK